MIDERLSAFLDGECDAAETERSIRALRTDAECRDAWQRQLWVREALHGDSAMPAHDPEFADRVTAALDAGETGADNVVPLTRERRWWGPVAGLAAAASVAAAVVLVTEPLTTGGPEAPGTTPGSDTVASEQGMAVASRAGSMATETGRTQQRQTADHWSVSDPAVADRLNGYLVEHNGLASSYGMSGARPNFVRVATYGQGEGR